MAHAEPPQAVRNRKVHIDLLFLDPKNPRLLVDEEAPQALLARKLYEEESLDELVNSFLENGYFEEEPLVVVPVNRQDPDGPFYAVEGNRRLATLKLLRSAELRGEVGVEDWPTASAEQLERLEDIPVVVYQERNEVLPYLGFRHITGAKKWAPFQRARFVAQMLEAGYDLEQVEDLIGDTTRAVKKLYQDYVVFNQAAAAGVPEAPMRDRFSLLEVTLGQAPIKEFLSMPSRLPDSPTEVLVPPERIDELREVVGWVFGTADVPPVVRESRDISRRLAPVVANRDSLDHLRRTADLEAAYEFSDGEREYLLKRLSAAERALRDAASYFISYAQDQDAAAALERVIVLVQGLERMVAGPRDA